MARVKVEVEMPTNEKTHIICILDRSGSMSNIIDDSVGGFGTFLDEQKKLPDEATISVVLFDDQYELVYDNIDIKKAEKISKEVWKPRGMTALYDAIGKTINSTRATFAKLDYVKPSKVLVCIVTDGQENASKEYKLDTIKQMIKECEDDNWNFIYLAANQDAFSVGSGFGISTSNTYTYTATSDGVFNMSATLSDATVSYRSMSSKDASFKLKSKGLINADNQNGSSVVSNTAGSITTDTNK
jgi:hypothetical protein